MCEKRGNLEKFGVLSPKKEDRSNLKKKLRDSDDDDESNALANTKRKKVYKQKNNNLIPTSKKWGRSIFNLLITVLKYTFLIGNLLII